MLGAKGRYQIELRGGLQGIQTVPAIRRKRGRMTEQGEAPPAQPLAQGRTAEEDGDSGLHGYCFVVMPAARLKGLSSE